MKEGDSDEDKFCFDTRTNPVVAEPAEEDEVGSVGLAGQPNTGFFLNRRRIKSSLKFYHF